MTALIAGTWAMISSSAEVITGARRMTLRIKRMVQPGMMELGEADRRRLFSLQKRVECLVQPLNYLLLWSKKRDSCVQQVVLSAQELLVDVCAFVERFVPPEGSVPSLPGGRPSPPPTLDTEQLDYYLRELEFACSSVSMAVNIARAHDAAPQGGPPVEHRATTSGAGRGSGVSLSALLRASRRVQEMRGKSGDLCACPGRLYSLTVDPLKEPLLGAAGCSSASSSGVTPEGGRLWTQALSLATFKIVSLLDVRSGRSRHCICVESRLPLSQRDDGAFDDDQDDGRGFNTSRPYRFAVDASLDAKLVNTAALEPQLELGSRVASLGVDSLALVWRDIPDASGEEHLDSEFDDAVLLDRGRAGGRASSSMVPYVASDDRFAFIFDAPRSPGEARPEGEVVLTPLDAVYLARLCALDAVEQPFGDSEAGSCPPHLLTSDEVLAALLEDGVTTYGSEAAPIPNAG